jgi:hypothetical protein
MRSLAGIFLIFFSSIVAAADDFSWLVPLDDLRTAPYRWGYFGGLYEDGSNVMAADHFAAGLAMASRIQPLDADGNPSAAGKVVFLAVGFGETMRIMCGANFFLPCEAGSFMKMAADDPRVNHQSLVILSAAREGADYRFWAERPDGSPQYERVANDTLAPAGVTPKQVQVAWLQIINDKAGSPLGIAGADAYRLKTFIAATLREMRRQYPNLQIAYLSSRVYGGYSTTTFNPEPFAYETGLANRWVITDQMEQVRLPHPEWHSDTRVGVIDYRTGIAPWLAWGPYFWANGATPRSDGLSWLRTDFEGDGETLSRDGANKAAKLLLKTLLTDPMAKGWFLSGVKLPVRGRAARH